MPENSVSPLAPSQFPQMPAIRGVELAVGRSGVRYRDRDDLLLVAFAPGTRAAGVFTRSETPGWPVVWSKQRARRGRARALLANAGNANVFTGKAGWNTVKACACGVADLIGCAASEVFLASTGIIGEPPATEKILGALPDLARHLAPASWQAAANAIRTTDTFAKGAAVTAKLGGASVVIGGIAKGSGMVAPNMATMLAFLFTDAKLPANVLRRLLAEATEASFNRITVDSDTSTSDMALLFATGQAEHPPVASADDPRLAGFRKGLQTVATGLALQIVRDGEGAEKLIAVNVTGAKNDRAATRIARAIADSPLVKTAVAGADANWGRIVAAIGKAGEKVRAGKLAIRIGAELVTRGGGRNPGYDEAKASAHLKGREIEIGVDVGMGRGRAKIWTCDLTHRYIDINATYRS
jgi:glutamate N-acetyltransferase/amino-acid N-acetyltransferase